MDWVIFGAMHLGIVAGLWMGYEWGYSRGKKKGLAMAREANRKAWAFIAKAVSKTESDGVDG